MRDQPVEPARIRQGLKRCPECGTTVTAETETCGVCGANLLDVPDQPVETAVAEEEKIEATDQARLKRKDTAEARRPQYLRLTLAVAGVLFWVVAIATYPLGPGFTFSRYGSSICASGTYRCVPLFNWTLIMAGLACLTTAIDPLNFLWSPTVED
jgi:hypothetical protein